MKTLYFDIDGTLLVNDGDAVKTELGAGKFEEAVRGAGFLRLVCVGNFASIAHAIKEIHADYDAIGVLFRVCRGAFQDEAWLRSRTVLVTDPGNRANEIDLSGDWWYVDDLAEHYMHVAGRDCAFSANLGGRICTPAPLGDGRDVLEWLSNTVP